MGATRAVAVVGFKASGKTRVVEALVGELTRRGRSVATLKHTSGDAPLDAPGTDTFRHAEAGAEVSAIISDSRVAIFLNRGLTLNEAAALLGAPEYMILEGFKSEAVCLRIIVARSQSEVAELSNGLEAAVADVEGGPYEAAVPVVKLSDAGRLADIVEAKAFGLLGGLDCKTCGYASCLELGKAILAREVDASKCVRYSERKTRIRVDGRDIALNPFTQKLVRNVVLGLASSIKDVGSPQRVEVETDE